MQKRTFSSLLTSLLLVFALAGCKSMAGSTSQPAAAQSTAVQNKLAAGTLLLEGTSQAVTAEQAAELLPLWKAVKSLSTSTTTSAVEMQALYNQITETMTADQVQAIKNMSITHADETDLMSKYSAQQMQRPSSANSTSSSSGTRSGSSASRSSSSAQPGGPGGDVGGGMPPDGGGMVAGVDVGGAQMGAVTSGTTATQTAKTSTKTVKASTQANSNLMFVDSLITLLQQRVDA